MHISRNRSHVLLPFTASAHCAPPAWAEITAFVLSRRDYTSMLCTGCRPASTLTVHTATGDGRCCPTGVRMWPLIKRPRDSCTDILKSLHRLPIRQIIEFKLGLLVHLAVNLLTTPTISSKQRCLTELKPLRRQQWPSNPADWTDWSSANVLSPSPPAPRVWNHLPSDIYQWVSVTRPRKDWKTIERVGGEQCRHNV